MFDVLFFYLQKHPSKNPSISLRATIFDKESRTRLGPTKSLPCRFRLLIADN